MPSTKNHPTVWPKNRWIEDVLLEYLARLGGEVEIGKKLFWNCSTTTTCLAFYFNKWGGEIVIILFHWASSCNYTSQKKRKELRERQIEKVCTYLEWSFEMLFDVMILNRKDFQSFHLWRPWSMTSLFDRQRFYWGKCRNTNWHQSSGICSSMKHQNLRCVSRLCYWFSSCFKSCWESLSLLSEASVHNCWSRYINLLLLGMS